MTEASETADAALKLSRIFAASRDVIFDAWTSADVIKEWFGPAGYTIPEASIDLRPGGAYRIVMLAPDGTEVIHEGVYVDVQRPERLVFTWILENQACEGSQDQFTETLVTIEFKDLEDQTELILTHERLPNQQSREGHKKGWNGSFDCLERTL